MGTICIQRETKRGRRKKKEEVFKLGIFFFARPWGMIATNVAPSIAIAIFSRASISVAKTSLKKGEERRWKKDAFKSNV